MTGVGMMTGDAGISTKGGSRRLVGRIAIDAIKFASVLVGAGLLLRTGAAVQAVSAISGPPVHDAVPAMPSRRISMPIVERIAGPVPARLRMIASGAHVGENRAGRRHRAFGTETGGAAPVLPEGQASLASVPILAGTTGFGHEAPIASVPGLIVSGQAVPVPTAPATAGLAAASVAPMAGLHARAVTHTDVAEAMRQPASAWDYYEPLPNEVEPAAGRGAPPASSAPVAGAESQADIDTVLPKPAF
ncbi:hypothetical protein [Novosphingobium nitrogenifigens]|nr:hypothetical protein [Novosphingobium nitrogenifigens]